MGSASRRLAGGVDPHDALALGLQRMSLSRPRVALFPHPEVVEAHYLDADESFGEVFTSTVRSTTDAEASAAAMSTVVEQIEHIHTGECFAAKIHRKANKSLDDVVTELQILSDLVCHPHIVQLYALYETPTTLIMVTELATGGPLLGHPAHKPNGTCPEPLAIQHVRGICEGVTHMHARCVAHCDLKPDNVMLFGPPHDLRVRIIGFGLAQTFTKHRRLRRVCGTSAYYSPEMVERYRGVEYDMNASYDKVIDVWGVGLIAYILLFGSNPFVRGCEHLTHEAILQEDIRIHFPVDSDVSHAAQACLRGLLDVSPEIRLSADAALQSDWLRRKSREEAVRSVLGAAAA